MKRTATFGSLFLYVFTLALWAQAPPQMPKPGPEHQRLHYFVGDWETITEAKPSPFGPGGKITAKDHNVMLGDFFVVFHSDSTGPMGQQKTVAVMGYDPKEKVYTYDGFTTSGERNKATGTVSGNAWVWTFSGEEQGKSFKGRFNLTEDSPTSYSFSEEMSSDGGPWTKLEEGKATKVK
jgi:Protein of unknown function (DUF1579)